MLNIAIIGAGYVGLVTGACFAQKGNRVIIVEKNQDKINALLTGKIPFYEPGLSDIVKQCLQSKHLSFTQDIQAALASHPSVLFLCVGTPSLQSGGADLSYVEQAAHEVGMHANNYMLVVNKSTVPVGTGAKVKSIIQGLLEQRQCTFEIDVASNPEFLKEGDAINDFLIPDRVIIGTDSEKALAIFNQLYTPFVSPERPILSMDIKSAELTKYASNAMLALRISFMNQLAQLADLLGVDIEQVKQGVAHDKRIGRHFLNAGIGYGGSCFPKDVKALASMGSDVFFPMTLIQEIENVNYFQRIWFINRIVTHYGPRLANKRAGIWGLAFKPGTDDIRSAPSLDVINELLAKGTRITAYDPVAITNIKEHFGNYISYATSPQDVLNNSDFLIILTEWKEFLTFQADDFAILGDKTIFDGRNCFDPAIMTTAGLTYACIGRNARGHQQTHLNVKSSKQKTFRNATL